MKKNSIALTWALTIFRIAVGWFFLYEGIYKLLTPRWTAEIYLMNTRWILSGAFHQMAASQGAIQVINFLNIWDLIIIGLSLLTGLFVRFASITGTLLLFFYYAAYPPIPGYTFETVAGDNYIWIDKTLILLLVFILFSLFPNGFSFGIDRLIGRWRNEKPCAPIPVSKSENIQSGRRELLRDLISVPFLGAFTYALCKQKKWNSYEEKYLGGITYAGSSATIKTFHFASLKDLKEQAPKGRIGNLELSRVTAGGNLIGVGLIPEICFMLQTW